MPVHRADRVVSAAPKLDLALAYDVEAAHEAQDPRELGYGSRVKILRDLEDAPVTRRRLGRARRAAEVGALPLRVALTIDTTPSELEEAEGYSGPLGPVSASVRAEHGADHRHRVSDDAPAAPLSSDHIRASWRNSASSQPRVAASWNIAARRRT